MKAAPEENLQPQILAWSEAGDKLKWQQGGCWIFYRDIGQSTAAPDKTLLILHGFPESSFSFHKVIDRLSEFFDRIVMVDLPGFGLSDKPTRLTYSLFEQTDALLFTWQQLKVCGGHVLGHDMGDSILTELVARSVQDVLPAWFHSGLHSLTFTDGNMVMEKAALVPTQRLLRQPGIGPIVSKLANFGLFRNQVTRANGAPLKIEDINDMWRLNTLQNGHRLSWKLIRYLDERHRFQDPRWLSALRRFDGPVHICWGASDKVSPPAVAEYLKREVCRDSKLTLMEGVGHFGHLQAPDQWSTAILDYFGSLAV